MQVLSASWVSSRFILAINRSLSANPDRYSTRFSSHQSSARSRAEDADVADDLREAGERWLREFRIREIIGRAWRSGSLPCPC
jgi:hypothetical protein